MLAGARLCNHSPRFLGFDTFHYSIGGGCERLQNFSDGENQVVAISLHLYRVLFSVASWDSLSQSPLDLLGHS